MINTKDIAKIAGALLTLALSGLACAQDTIQVNDHAVDLATLRTPAIARNVLFKVHTFDASKADLGKAKHRDTARRAANTVPHLLAVDIVESLRDHGFENVVLDDADTGASVPQLNLFGRFTTINPGSQAARAWIGFGAGESEVCVAGVISDSSGQELGDFSHCGKGLGWGGSDGQLDKNAIRIGESISTFLATWADGKYSH